MIIERYPLLNNLGTFGKTRIDNMEIFTVEQPWKGNKPFESCVPLGHYKLIPFSSDKYGELFALESERNNVFLNNKGYGRYACLAFHRGNFPSNFQGCIGAGDSFIIHNDVPMITNTRRTCKLINEYLRDTGDTNLIIISAEAG